jgi:hypothetical protein
MDQPFNIPDDTQCKRTSYFLNCQAILTLDYIRRTYTVDFGNYSLLTLFFSFDKIQITSKPEFLYTIAYTCFKEGDDCALHYIQRKIPEMVTRNYNIFGVVSDLSTLLAEPSPSVSPETSFNCYYDTYNTNGNIGPCLSSNGRPGRCLIDYNQWSHVIRSQECEQSSNDTIAVTVYDSESQYTALEIACKKNLCNTKLTVEEVIKVLTKYDLTDASGGTGRGGAMKLSASQCFIGLGLLFSQRAL